MNWRGWVARSGGIRSLFVAACSRINNFISPNRGQRQDVRPRGVHTCLRRVDNSYGDGGRTFSDALVISGATRKSGLTRRGFQARSRSELIDFRSSNPYPPIEVALPDRAAMPRMLCEENEWTLAQSILTQWERFKLIRCF
jgi:hypothetical protein